jgi:hypothetical protein
MDDYELMHIAFFAEDGLVDYLYTKYKALLEKGFKQMTYD